MTSSSFQSVLFVSIIALSAGIKTESMVEMRNDIMMEHIPVSALPETKASSASLSSKIHENFNSLEVAIAVQMATQQRFVAFLKGSVLLVLLAAIGLYAINNQSGKNGKQACAVDADVKPSPDPLPTQVELQSAMQTEQDLDAYLEQQHVDADCDDDSVYLKHELDKMLEDNLEAEADAACVIHTAQDVVPLLSRADVETMNMIEQELDKYLDCQHVNQELDADFSVLKSELNKMLDNSLEAEAAAATVIHSAEEEVDVSRIEMEIAEQMSEALGFSQVPAWM